ncbi:phospholipase C-like [Patiria miniata]|uniref:sphingomyelin phosphodiesterase n=1 Tax=Patiria miniata TaxID=46514 RepID=A0A914BL84_PATMI|nr:phospholipase C-like [Patiria miniata]
MLKMLLISTALYIAVYLKGCSSAKHPDNEDEVRYRHNKQAQAARQASYEPRVWIDNAPDCQADASHCQHFGLEYVRSDTISELGHACEGGTKVMCTLPNVTPLANPTAVNTLKIISYNIFELPYSAIQSGQRERTCRIPAEIFKLQPDVDVIVFQEVFLGGCIVTDDDATSLTLRQILRAYGFVHFTQTVGDHEPKTLPKMFNGGVFIASRWPIVTETQKVFVNYDTVSIYEAMLAKGVVYAKVKKTNAGLSKNYHIFGTHMQSSELPTSVSVRLLQAGEIYEFMQQQKIPVDEPVLHAGDLNANNIGKPEHAQAVFDTLQATLPLLRGVLRITYDYQHNDFIEDTDPAEFLDYILFCRLHEQPTNSALEVFRPLIPDPLEICRGDIPYGSFMYPNDPDCPAVKTVTDLSDHNAVLGVFTYPQSTSSGKFVLTRSSGAKKQDIEY